MNINLHGRLPEDLPDKMTINDILLELKDTKKFDINWISLNPTWQNIWRANNKSFEQWSEKGEVRVMKCDFTSTFNKDWSDSQLDTIPMPTMTYKEIRYSIFRYPIRLEVRLKEEVPAKDGRAWSKFMIENSKIVDEVKETYLRLKDYLGPDVIQDRSAQKGVSYVRFTIDFMISECKVI